MSGRLAMRWIILVFWRWAGRAPAQRKIKQRPSLEMRQRHDGNGRLRRFRSFIRSAVGGLQKAEAEVGSGENGATAGQGAGRGHPPPTAILTSTHTTRDDSEKTAGDGPKEFGSAAETRFWKRRKKPVLQQRGGWRSMPWSSAQPLSAPSAP
jgi:hypothetical protein